MPYRFHGHAEVDPGNPRAWATCDDCGRLFNLYRLNVQRQWAGTQIINLNFLVCDDCRDIPQEQLRSITLPADPPAVIPSRPEAYQMDEISFRVTMFGDSRVTQNGDFRTIQDQGGTTVF